MKAVYPVFITEGDKYYLVRVPDFDIDTQGEGLADAIEMARDAIGLMGIELEDEGKESPKPKSVNEEDEYEDAIKTLVDVDFDEYRRQQDTRLIKRNCTIPSNLSMAADKAGLNVSMVLRNALAEQLKGKVRYI